MRTKAKTAHKQIHSHSGQSLEFLKSTSLFSNLSDKEIAVFHSGSRELSYKKGKVLYLEESPAEFFYIIRHGWIKLFHTLPEGTEVVVDMLTTSQAVGLSAFFENGLHTSNAQIVEDVQLLAIPLSLLENQIHASSALALNMLSAISRLHRLYCTQIALNSTRRAPQRVGSFLLRLCPEGKKKGIIFHLPYDKTLIAGSLGMTRGSFSRALNILRQKAGIRISGTCVEIDSVEKLMRFVYGSIGVKW